MEKNVIISIKGVQRLEDADPDTMELVTEGRLEQDGNSYTLSYQESELTGLEGTLTTFQVEPDRVTLLRVGESTLKWCSRRAAATWLCTIRPMAP